MLRIPSGSFFPLVLLVVESLKRLGGGIGARMQRSQLRAKPQIWRCGVHRITFCACACVQAIRRPTCSTLAKRSHSQSLPLSSLIFPFPKVHAAKSSGNVPQLKVRSMNSSCHRPCQAAFHGNGVQGAECCDHVHRVCLPSAGLCEGCY